MYIFTPDLSERKRLLRNVCRTHPQWKIRISLAVVLFIMAIGVLCGFACLLMAHPTSTEGVVIFAGAAVCFACIPFAFALSVKNTAKYKCAFPYSGYANASLLLDEDTLEYVFWRVGPHEPAAYSSKRAVYRAEDRFVYKINKAEITSLTIKDGVCKIKGNGKVQMPEWAEEDALVKKKNKDFSFVMAFEQRDATRHTLSWRMLD